MGRKPPTTRGFKSLPPLHTHLRTLDDSIHDNHDDARTTRDEVTSLRLDRAVREELALIAAVNGTNVSEVIRQALGGYLAGLKTDPVFRRAVDTYMARQRRILLGDTG